MKRQGDNIGKSCQIQTREENKAATGFDGGDDDDETIRKKNHHLDFFSI